MTDPVHNAIVVVISSRTNHFFLKVHMNTQSLPVPNSPIAIKNRINNGQIPLHRPLLMLFSRLFLFSAAQALMAAWFALKGNPHPWQQSIAWWPVSVTVSNLICLILLDRLARREGITLKDLYRVEKHSFWRELLILAVITVISGPLSMLPNFLLGNVLFGDINIATEMFFRPLPLWVVIAFSGILFPITIALTEIPTYYSYAMPRLTAKTGRGWAMVALAGFMHAAQHIALPLIFDLRFITWRLLMFLPFALFMAAVLRWRPRLLPYLMVIHGLMDFSLMFMLLPVAMR